MTSRCVRRLLRGLKCEDMGLVSRRGSSFNEGSVKLWECEESSRASLIGSHLSVGRDGGLLCAADSGLPREGLTCCERPFCRHFRHCADKGRLIAQVLAPKLALVTPSLPAAAFQGEALGSKAMLEIQAPGMPKLEIPLKRPAKQGNSTVLNVNIYGWEGRGVDEGSKAASWWSSYLGRSVRFVRFNPALVDRQVAHAPDGYQTGFSNTGQFLVASEASLEDLNDRLPKGVQMNRFRPNFIINGPPAFEEDKWGRFSITHSGEELLFTFVHPCARCKVPTINQENPEGTGEEPLKTLATFRTGNMLQVNVGGANQVFFGTYFVCADTLSNEGSNDNRKLVAVNDPLFVSEFNSTY